MQACPYCGSWNTRRWYFLDGGGVERCRSCDLIFRADRGDEAGWANYYRERYAQDYSEEQRGPWRDVIYAEALDSIERRVKKGALFDVAAGSGSFLAMAAGRGWAVSGQEISSESCRAARARYGLELRQGDLKNMALETDAYDAVTMINVLDHLPNPWSLLAKVSRALRPGGLVYIRLPHGGLHSFGLHMAGFVPGRELRRRVRNLFVLHRYHITPRFIRKALGSIGFRPVIVCPSVPSRGVPYPGLRPGERCMQSVLKGMFPPLSSALFRLSAGKWVLSPSIQICGVKE